ncbi:carboxypeptidase-like regulatory domain-containing protein [Winogradskyella sp. KYW1333]|jgi:hypothetical protein|uniref:carboxypeptidase-like regulatory domain-containing protein n=1 Tax=unclassified Winogradskyella TaxID=2615021 RepID=UPI000DF47133|nr:carboxypeptidase-like regulatory domain-containing protein [Winogradskyella sp. KYW1333]RCT56471.1 hypothetical protein DUZ96_00155 [Winogradskyella sp. KYW1333]
MKVLSSITALLFLAIGIFFSDNKKILKNDGSNKSGYLFTINVTKINSKYSEIPAAVFRNKLVIVSSKKIGALGGKIDKSTGEPISNLFCTEFNEKKNDFTTPILFSRILNTKNSEGQVAFSPDQHTVYYTRNSKENPFNFQLYVANLEKDSYGNWINHKRLEINSVSHSIENPHATSDGKFLYFSSNREGGFGGYDLYKAYIRKDGSLSEPINLGRTINTSADEKYPYTVNNESELFFSSKGHNSVGGFDIFVANNYRNLNYSEPRSLGPDVNSQKDEIAFTFIDNENGVFSSDKDNNARRFNMYRFNAKEILQTLRGVIVAENDEKLINSIVVLYDAYGNEIERKITDRNGIYEFQIRPYEVYNLRAIKDGYKDSFVRFQSNENNRDVAFTETVQLKSQIN